MIPWLVSPQHPESGYKMPYFSVVIPTHNRAHLIERAISSVLAQTCTDFELIVVDDGSSDDTKTVVERIGDPRIRYVYQQNAGAAAARNHGARLATGEYLTFLDSDDEALPQWLEMLSRGFMEAKAEIVCCGLEKVGHGPEVEERGGVLLPGDMGPMVDHAVGRFTNGGVYAMRTALFREIGGFAERLACSQHTELGMRLAPVAQERGWKIHNIMEPLIRVHVHAGHRIRTNPRALYEGTTYLLREYAPRYRQYPDRRANAHGIAGVNAARMGMFGTALRHFLIAVVANPLSAKAWARLFLACIPGFMRRRWGRPAPKTRHLASGEIRS
jgi:glycosyltransferase involved in cell wall biosynthesis